jgi:thiol-disulfide isomerase/thioredoxin
MSDEQAPSDPQPSGFRSAMASGLSAFAAVTVIGLLLSAVIWFVTKSADAAVQLVLRTTLVGVAVGGAVVASRVLSGATMDRLMTVQMARGEFSGTVGFLVGVVVGGWFAEQSVMSSEQSPIKVGAPIEIAGPTATGGRFDLAERKGKVALVDFWATWCGPCLAEVPNIRATYDKYEDHGFEVVGVNLDDERATLSTHLESHPEPWPQIFFDEEGKRGFQNPLVRRFDIQSIPLLLVVGRDGNVAAVNVRGRGIETVVASALGVPVSWSSRAASFGSQVMRWLVLGIFASPWWMLLLGGVGGAAILAGVEALLRRGFSRPVVQ